MTFVDRLVAEICVRTEEPFVRRSQLHALAKQLPLLYVTLCTNACALAFTHIGSAPAFMSFYIPAMLVLACAIRVVQWRRLKIEHLSDEEVARALRRTVVRVAVLGVGFTGWSLALYPYGDAYEKSHVAFFMSITVVGCIFCMIHLRAAAVALTLIVTIPFSIVFLYSGHLVFIAIAINFLIVATVMTFMSLAYYKDFRRLVHSMEDLAHLSEANKRAAHVDSLTDLANRRRFFQDLDETIAEHSPREGCFALGLIDLDGFKPINDLHGHQAGDQVLIEISRRLEMSFVDTLKVARLGGDEFGLILRCDGEAEIQAIGHAICELLGRPIRLESAEVKVGASIGFAVFPAMGRTQAQLIERADFALYHAKQSCRGTPVIFTDDHAMRIRDRRLLEHELRRADLDEQLSVVFQPMVDIRQRRIIGFEALARWKNPTLGVVSPADFIPAAERTGLIKNLTQVLFRKACRAASQWPDDIRLSFNLSVDDLMDENADARLTAMVRLCPLAPSRLTFEITETAIMRDFDRAKAALKALRALGCGIALDDFGTGYSSLSYVHRLPLDKLKIDQSFVRSLAKDATSRTIIKSIIDLSYNLGMPCVVEGVETAEQVEILRLIGCTAMQGYFFGRPAEATDISFNLDVMAMADIAA